MGKALQEGRYNLSLIGDRKYSMLPGIVIETAVDTYSRYIDKQTHLSNMYQAPNKIGQKREHMARVAVCRVVSAAVSSEGI